MSQPALLFILRTKMNLLYTFGKNGVGREYEYKKIKRSKDLILFLYREAKPVVSNLLKKLNFTNKFAVEVNVVFEKPETNLPGEIVRLIRVDPWFRSRVHTYWGAENLEETLHECFEEILSAYDNWTRAGSGWYFVRIKKLHLSIARFKPLSGGCTSAAVSCFECLPSPVRYKRALYKFKNIPTSEIDRCFLHTMRAAHYIATHGHKNTSIEFDLRNTEKEDAIFDLRGITFPTDLLDIKTFEKRNNVSINVYTLNARGVNRTRRNAPGNQHPLNVLYYSKMMKDQVYFTADLLLYKDHYYLFRSMSRMFGYLGPGEAHICKSCMTVHKNLKSYNAHKRFCDNSGNVYTMPAKRDATIKFTKYEAKVAKNFAIYYDCETGLQSLPLPTGKSTRKTLAAHVPIIIGAKMICYSNANFNSELYICEGEDCVQDFLDFLDIMLVEISLIYQTVNFPLKMNEQDWKDYLAQNNCGMCGQRFTPKTQKHRDHDHLKSGGTGRNASNYRNALCRGCNLSRAKNIVYNVPVFAHCGASFDTKLLIREMGDRIRSSKQHNCRFRVINKSRENNMALFYKEYMFLDSYNFLSTKLSELIDCRMKDDKDGTTVAFPLLLEYCDGDKNKYRLLGRKGVCPYSILTSDYEALKVITQLPDKSAFYNTLRNESITDDDYRFARVVWETWECENLAEYLRIYLSVDVLALAQIIEGYRNIGMKEFGLDAAYFFSSSQMSWHQLLHFSKVEVELIQNIDIYNTMYENVRGG